MNKIHSPFFDLEKLIPTDKEMQEAIANGEKIMTVDKSDDSDCTVESYIYNGQIFVNKITFSK